MGHHDPLHSLRFFVESRIVLLFFFGQNHFVTFIVSGADGEIRPLLCMRAMVFTSVWNVGVP